MQNIPDPALFSADTIDSVHNYILLWFVQITAVLVYVDSRVVFSLYITQTGISPMLSQFHNSFISYRVAMPSKPLNKEAPLNLMLEDDTISLDEEDFHHHSAILDALDDIDVDENPDADDQQ